MLTKEDKRKIVTRFLLIVVILPVFYLAYEGPHGKYNWERLNNEYQELYQQSRYNEAAKVAEDMMIAVSNKYGGNHHKAVITRNNLAFAYQALGKYDDAEPLFRIVLEISEEFHAPKYPNHPELTTSLYNLAKLYEDQGKYVDAMSLYKRILTIHKKSQEPNRPKVVKAQENIVRIDKKMKENKKEKIKVTAVGYTDNGNGTVTDVDTGLIWQKGDDGVYRTWKEAQIYCDDLSLAGHTNWRLPDLNELRSLVDDKKFNPVINTSFFPNAYSWHYWSSTISVPYTAHAFYMNFSNGKAYTNSKTSHSYVRCVRFSV